MFLRSYRVDWLPWERFVWNGMSTIHRWVAYMPTPYSEFGPWFSEISDSENFIPAKISTNFFSPFLFLQRLYFSECSVSNVYWKRQPLKINVSANPYIRWHYFFSLPSLLKIVLEMAVNSNNMSVLVDVLNVLYLKRTLWTLDMALIVLPELKLLMRSKYTM